MAENKRLKNVISWLISQELVETQEDFAVKLDCNPSYLSQIVTGTKPLSKKFAQKIIDFCDKINIDYLFGEGDMLRGDEKAVKLSESNMGGIPLIPVNAAAGFGKGEFQIMEYECDRYVVPMFKGAEFLIPVKGNSMMPKYNSGDVVACKNIPLQDIFFQWNKVYVLDTIQGALIKRIKQGSDDDHILIVSENPKYDPFELHKEKINGVALVIGVIRLE